MGKKATWGLHYYDFTPGYSGLVSRTALTVLKSAHPLERRIALLSVFMLSLCLHWAKV